MRCGRAVGAVGIVVATLFGSVGGAAAVRQRATVSWQLLSGARGGLPSTATVTSAVRFRGRLYVTGAVGAGGPAKRCESAGCNPAVWSSLGGSSWVQVLSVPARGSTPGSLLAASSNRLVLFAGGMGTALWTSRTGQAWRGVPLTRQMGALSVRDVVWYHHKFVAVLGNRFAGGPNHAYGASDEVWTSPDGLRWRQAHVAGPPSYFASIAATRSGYILGGSSRVSGRSEVWTSSTGENWRLGSAPSGHGALVLGVRGRHVVAVQLNNGAAGGSATEGRLSWRDGGSGWHRASPDSYMISLRWEPSSVLLVVKSGFLVVGSTPASLYLSKTGSSWAQTADVDAPKLPAGSVQSLSAVGDPQMMVVTASSPAASRANGPKVWAVTVHAT